MDFKLEAALLHNEKMRKLLQWTIVIFSVITSQAQKSYPDTLYAYFTNEKITLDGELTEGCWKEAMKISNFTQRELYEGELINLTRKI